MQNLNFEFVLFVTVPDQSPRKLEVATRVLAGLDPRNDLILVDPKIKAKHFLFKRTHDDLSVQYLGADGDTVLNGLPLENGKLYLLQENDLLKVGKIEIKILKSSTSKKKLPEPDGSLSHKESVLNNAEVKIEEKDIHEILTGKKASEKVKAEPKQLSRPSTKIVASKKHPLFDFSTIRLIPYKFYGFIIDLALSYALLAFIIPSTGMLSQIQEFLSPITSFFLENILIKYPEYSHYKLLSVLEFLVGFHSFMIFCSLILGTTPGAFLIGLHHLDSNKSYFAIRFKAYIYALLNIAALPLLIFDIPLIRGKTFKELVTFSERSVNSSILFKISRRAFSPLLIIACLTSPFFLKPPFSAVINEEKVKAPKFSDPHTYWQSSKSSLLGMSLKYELNKQYILLPYFEKKKIGLVLFDLLSNKSLIMREEKRSPFSEELFKLRYSNPLSSLTIPNQIISAEAMKNLATSSINLSLDNVLYGLAQFGPFLGNTFLYKYEFLKNFSSVDNFFIMTFGPKNPGLKISDAIDKKRTDKVFLFFPNEIVEFSLVVPKQTKLLENFSEGVLKGLSFSNSKLFDKESKTEILEALEAFQKEDYETLLTYYSNEAKKAQELNNQELRTYLVKNILQTKRALNENSPKNIEKSFDDIINSL